MFTAVVASALALLVAAPAHAQSWAGWHIGGSVGSVIPKRNASETITFDTNLDRIFTDEVRTASGANAFSPGFCGGLAVNATAAAGCMDDDAGIDAGGRLGYDWQVGRFVFGGLVDVSRTEVVDSVTAFSTTPAFYSFTREAETLAGLRGRVGIGSNRVLAYATFGGAWANIDEQFTTSNSVNTFVRAGDIDDDDEGTKSVWGYQAGGGIEIRLGGHWSLGGEYVFTSLDDRNESTIRAQGPAPATNPFILVNASGTDFRRSGSLELQAVRAMLSYRF
ncbi:MAG: outer membrane beta-barrel protein [Vicinamibacterales bacterium]